MSSVVKAQGLVSEGPRTPGPPQAARPSVGCLKGLASSTKGDRRQLAGSGRPVVRWQMPNQGQTTACRLQLLSFRPRPWPTPRSLNAVAPLADLAAPRIEKRHSIMTVFQDSHRWAGDTALPSPPAGWRRACCIPSALPPSLPTPLFPPEHARTSASPALLHHHHHHHHYSQPHQLTAPHFSSLASTPLSVLAGSEVRTVATAGPTSPASARTLHFLFRTVALASRCTTAHVCQFFRHRRSAS